MPVSNLTVERFVAEIVHAAAFTVATHNDYTGAFLGKVHRHADFYQVSYVLKGQTRALLGNRCYPVSDGDLLLIPPGKRHASVPGDERKKFELLQIKFSLPHFLPLPLPAYIRLGHPPAVLTLFYSIINEFHMRRPQRETMMRLDLARLILLVNRQYSSKGIGEQLSLTTDSARIEQRLAKVIRHIMANYSRRLSRSEMAGISGYSASRFAHAFKRHAGISPVSYLINYRLSKALDLMSNTERKLEDIAAEVGFSSVYYFSRLFHKRYHQSPRRYARMIYNAR